MMLSSISRLFCGIILLTVPTIIYGGYYLLTVLSGQDGGALTDFQKAMFRAGHAHAGVLVLLSLIVQGLIDNTRLGGGLAIAVRIGFPLAAILVSAGFFTAAIGQGLTKPNAFIGVLYTGALVLVASVLVLGIALIKVS